MPAPALALRIGITGHLDVADSEALYERSRAILAQFKESATSCRERFAKDSIAGPSDGLLEVRLHLISCFAAGADQIVAAAAEKEEYQLHGILPTARASFAKDVEENCSADERKGMAQATLKRDHAFAAFRHFVGVSDSVIELSEVRKPEMHEYEAAGWALLANIDVLIAVVGRAATTGLSFSLVNSALEYGIPVIWISPDPAEGIELRMPARSSSTQPTEEPATAESIDRVVQALVFPGSETSTPKVNNLFNRMLSWFEDRYGRTFNPTYNELEWRESWPEPALLDSLTFFETFQQIERNFRTVAIWADHQAAVYSGLYRGAFVLNTTLGSAAVALALVGIIDHHMGSYAKSIELFTLLLMSAVFTIAHQRQWRDRWLNFRALYQRTHHQARRFMFGQSRPQHNGYEFGMSTLSPGAQRMLTAVTRAAGLPAASASPRYLEAVRKMLLKGLVERQCRYFNSEAEDHLELHERYEARITWCVYLATLATAGYIFVWLMDFGEHAGEVAFYIGTYAGALLPAMAAAFVAVAGFEEHGQLSSRYREMSKILARIREDLRLLGEVDPHNRHLTREVIGRLLDAAVDTADEELTHWRLVLSGKSLDRF